MTTTTPKRPTLTLGPKPVTSAWLYAHANELRADGSSDLYRMAADIEARAYALEQQEAMKALRGQR